MVFNRSITRSLSHVAIYKKIKFIWSSGRRSPAIYKKIKFIWSSSRRSPELGSITPTNWITLYKKKNDKKEKYQFDVNFNN